MNKFEKDLYNFLIENKSCTALELDAVVADCDQRNLPFVSAIIKQNIILAEELFKLISKITDIPFISLKAVAVSPEALKIVSSRFAWHYQFVPIKLEGKTLIIAVSNPLSISAQDEIRFNLGCDIRLVLATKEDIVDLLNKYYGLGGDTVEKMIESEDIDLSQDYDNSSLSSAEVQDIEKLAEDASVIKLVNQIILQAYKKRATDIHIEPQRNRLRLRYRIDGKLYDQNVPDAVVRFIVAIISRIKIMSNLNIVERRIPQDGRAIVKTQDQLLDLRVSVIPTPHGESVVIRILPTQMFFDFERIGLSPSDAEIINSLIVKPNGIIFVTGPTGSGKTTTLYACLKKINTENTKIITVEDPVEYEIDNVTQIHVNNDLGLTFAKGLRSILRHDPDIVMIGEVRDQETAEIAIRVALTGHLVFSTLHTNDAAGAITRLIDIGIKPYLVASSVQAFVAQRLVRTICDKCRQEITEIDPLIRRTIKESLAITADDVRIYKGRGCAQCGSTGFYGRTALYEILLVDEDIQNMINEQRTVADIKQAAIAKGMKTLIHDGWLKVVAGTTTVEEVLDVCQNDYLGGAVFPKRQDSEKNLSPDRAKKNKSPSELYPDDKRIYIRAEKNVGILYKVVEKGEGDIIKLNRQEGSMDFDNLFMKVSSEKISEADFNVYEYKEVTAKTANISAGGLMFESQYLIPQGSLLDIRVQLDSVEISCLAKVVRVEKDLPKCFSISVCYLDISGADRNRLEDFVKG
ncbi:MAG: ATPase, T2SS/T4P/T4SS family [Candidatus Omnitrophica bacterium]|nr:ATPase, T2SS/T4P/T4SS family [Candidatus Omnitrophota bacterium]